MEKIEALLSNTTGMSKSLTTQTQTISATVAELRSALPHTAGGDGNQSHRERANEMQHYARLLTASASSLADSSTPDKSADKDNRVVVPMAS